MQLAISEEHLAALETAAAKLRGATDMMRQCRAILNDVDRFQWDAPAAAHLSDFIAECDAVAKKAVT